MADELGALRKEYDLAIAPFKQKLVRMKALEQALQLACPADDGDEWTTEGAQFGVRLSARANERSIDYKKLLKRISMASFVRFATCTLKALDKNVSLEIINEVVSIEPTGPRKITTFEKGTVA